MNMLDLAQLQQLYAVSKPPPIAEFRAGILTQAGTTVTADPRRGKVVVETGDDRLLHFKWLLRPGNQTELDLTILPGTGKFEKVPECTDGRVFLLTTTTGTASKKHFFWMQEPKDDKDEELFKKVCDGLKATPSRAGADLGMGMLGQQARGGRAGGAQARGAAGDPMAQLMQLLQQAQRGPNSASGASTAATPASATSTRPAGSASDTASSTSSSSSSSASALASQLEAMMARQQVASTHDLGEILNTDRVVAALSDQQIDLLLPHLPAGQQTRAEFIAQMRCPQFRATLSRLTSLLNSGSFGAFMASASLDRYNTSGLMGVEAFTRAIQNQADAETPSSASASSSASSAAAEDDKGQKKMDEDKK